VLIFLKGKAIAEGKMFSKESSKIFGLEALFTGILDEEAVLAELF